MISVNGYVFQGEQIGDTEIITDSLERVVVRKYELSILISNYEDMTYAMDLLYPRDLMGTSASFQFPDSIGQYVAVTSIFELVIKPVIGERSVITLYVEQPNN